MIALIIPALNEEKTLPRCLGSIENQKDKNIKLILVNNGSTDKTKEILKGFSISSSIETIILSEPKIGKSQALKTAVKFVIKDPTIDIVAFSDADTYFSPQWSVDVQKLFSANKKISYAYATEFFMNNYFQNLPNFKTLLDKYTKLLDFTNKFYGGYMVLNNCFVRKACLLESIEFEDWSKSIDTLLTIKLVAKGYLGGYCKAQVVTSPRRILDNGNLDKWCSDQDIRQFVKINEYVTWKPVRKIPSFPCDITNKQMMLGYIKRSKRLIRRLIILNAFLSSDQKKENVYTNRIVVNSTKNTLLNQLAIVLSKINIKMSYYCIDIVVKVCFKKEILQGSLNLLNIFKNANMKPVSKMILS